MQNKRQILINGALILSAGLFLLWLAATPNVTTYQPADQSDSVSQTDVEYALPAALPHTIRIPTVGIEADFEAPLGVNPDQTIAVPDGFDTVGWYQYGPTPGELGPAVVLGHVDSFAGPAVFFSLGQLDVGDDIFIDRADGSTAQFVVTRMLREAQDNFPTAAVYGDLDYAGLRLITCSGEFIRGEQRYTHNLIVFAKLVPFSEE